MPRLKVHSLATKLGAVSEQNKHTNKKPKQRGSSKAKIKPLLFFFLPLRDQGILCLLLAVWHISPKMCFVSRLVGSETQVHLC